MYLNKDSMFRVSICRYLVRYNSISSRYHEKLAIKAKQIGVATVEELKQKMAEQIATTKKELNKIDPLAELEAYERKQAAKLTNKGDAGAKSIAKETPKLPYKTLNDYVDLTKLQELPRREIEYIWKARFADRPKSVHAIIDNVQFSTMYANAFKNPNFILPLPRDNGYEMHFIQWSFVGPATVHCMLTTVAEYKLHGEFAKPHTTLSFHQELTDKGVVLMNGIIENDNIPLDEAQLLVLNVQRFYGMGEKPDQEKLKILTQFTTGDEKFSTEELIKHATTF
ncbi:Protein ATP11 mitochondrial [Spathaspora sp. JA1]|nr:Protein ATP11 mitochondrial [Spathaspora sp. JA1]